MKKTIKLLLGITLLIIAALFILAELYPYNYSDIIKEEAKKNDVDPLFVASIIKTESNFDEKATSLKDAKGLMQITDETALWCLAKMGENITGYDLYDPATNIKIGTWFYKYLCDKFGNQSVALAAYNAGTGNVALWLKDEKYSKDGKSLKGIPFAETELYVEKVQTNYKIYNFLYKDEGGILYGIGTKAKEWMGRRNAN